MTLRSAAIGGLPLWLDEAFSLAQVTRRASADWWLDVHPPLYYALLWLWTRGSTTDAWLRLLSAVLGAATVPAVYALGRRLADPACGLWAATFLAVTWVHVWYSREARMYTLLVLCFTFALLGLVAGARDGRGWGWVVYVLAGAAVAWSHAVGIYYAAILAGLGLLIPREDGQKQSLRPWLAANAAIGLLYVPWLPAAIARTRDVTESYWIKPSTPDPPLLSTLYSFTIAPAPSLASLLRPRLGLDPGPAFSTWIWFVPLLAVLVLAFAGGSALHRAAARLLALAYLAPIVLFTALSLTIRPILIPRILLPVVVPLVVLLALGVGSMPNRWMRGAAGVVTALLLLLATTASLRTHAGHWEDWRAASRHLQDGARPGDIVMLANVPGRRLVALNVDPASTGMAVLLRRYDETGRLAGVGFVSPQSARAGCHLDVDSCFDRAVSGVPAEGHVWLVRRSLELPEPVQSWAARRLEPGPIERFPGVIVERRRSRPSGSGARSEPSGRVHGTISVSDRRDTQPDSQRRD